MSQEEFTNAIGQYKEKIGQEPFQPLSSLLNKLKSCISKSIASQDVSLELQK